MRRGAEKRVDSCFFVLNRSVASTRAAVDNEDDAEPAQDDEDATSIGRTGAAFVPTATGRAATRIGQFSCNEDRPAEARAHACVTHCTDTVRRSQLQRHLLQDTELMQQ